MNDPRSILLLCDDSREHADNVLQHIEALARLSRHDVSTFNPLDHASSCRLLDLEEFDVVVVHYTVAVTIERYMPRELRDKVARFQGLKIQFIQDEYRWVDAVSERIRELGIDVLFTLVPPGEIEKVYGDRIPGVTALTTLAGYVPDALVGRRTPPIGARPIHVGYRGRALNYWLGRLGREKASIAEDFLARAHDYDLRCDISTRENDRMYGERWHRFLASCRTTLGTESGASIVDFDGSIEAAVKEYLVRNPQASFDQVEQEILAPYEGNARINVVSPRVFEAAALRTALIQFPGEYSDVVEPWTHYIPLERDFSNFDVVVASLLDTAFLESLTARAYGDLVASERYSLWQLVGQFDELVELRSEPRRRAAGHRAYTRARIRSRVPTMRGPSQLWITVGAVLRPFASACLAFFDPSVRRLALAWIRRREARDAVSAGDLADDLWRLAALRRMVLRGDDVHVVPTLELDGRRLLFVLRPGRMKGTNSGAQMRPSVAAAAAGGMLDEIIWDHTAVSEHVPLLGAHALHAPVGRHGIAGAHRFRAIEKLSTLLPNLVMDAFDPLLPQEPSVRPARALARRRAGTVVGDDVEVEPDDSREVR
jgi:hypothetical protein